MTYRSGLKRLVVSILLLVASFLFFSTASAATVNDIPNNSLRIGDDIYELNNTSNYTFENVLDSINRSGGVAQYYFKIGNRWYDLLQDDINTFSDLLDPDKAVPAAEVQTWLLTYRYGYGETVEIMEPVLSTYLLEYSLPEVVYENEDISVSVALCTEARGAVGYDEVAIAFSASGPGGVTFKTGGGREHENVGVLDAFILPPDYSESEDWTLCFSEPGDYSVSFALIEQTGGAVIAGSVQELRVYPSEERVLAELEGRILAALEVLELEETGVSGVDYAGGSVLVSIDEPGSAVADFIASLVGAFRGSFADITGAEFYVSGKKVGMIENPAAMGEAALIDALWQELIRPLAGEKAWEEVTLGDLSGKGAAVELTVTVGAVEYSASYELHFAVIDYSVTFVDHDGTVLDVQTVEHGAAAVAPADPEREGFVFAGWDTAFTEVTSDLVVTARYIDPDLAELKDLIDVAEERARPDYTGSLEEWDNYWGGFMEALTDAKGVYDELEVVEELSAEQRFSLTQAKQNLQRAVEILEGIEDFDAALGDRVHPQGLVETVYRRSLVGSDGFQAGRIRCYYDKESGKFYWMLSGFVQGQGLYEGTTGTGMNGGLQNVMLSDSIIKLQSGEHVIDIYHDDGTRKSRTELENDGIALAIHWLTEAGISPWIYANLVGLVEDCILIGATSDGVEFQRTYTFHFIDGGTYLFDPGFRYCVIDGLAQRDFKGYNIINTTQDLKYTDGTAQEAIDDAEPGDYIHLAGGVYNESIIVDKSINLVGSYVDGVGAGSIVLSGDGITGVPGITIAGGVSDVTIRGFEITGFDSGGIVGQGSGINSVSIEDNYIHDVGGEAVFGGTDGAELLNGWSVAGNRIEDCGGAGIRLLNIGAPVISNNTVDNSVSGSGIAVGVAYQADGSSITADGVTICGNDIAEGAVNITSERVSVNDVTVDHNTLANGSVEVWARAAKVEGVKIQHNDIFSPDKAISVEARADATPAATVREVEITENEITAGFMAIDVQDPGTGNNNLRNFVISSNKLEIEDPIAEGCAVNLVDVRGDSDFINNTVSVNGTIAGGGSVFNGVEFSGNRTGAWFIYNNELQGNNVGTAGSGIRLRSNLKKGSELLMFYNRVTGWAQGVLADDLTLGVAVELNFNWIYGNSSHGIANGSGASIDATYNYWGHASGPLHDTNPDGQGNAVSDNVNFDPWYIDEGFKTLSD